LKRFLAALACCGVLSLSACNGDSSSSADPPSPSPTASTSSVEPSPTEDPESPEEFVRRWVDVDREMQNSGDTTEYRQLSAKCRPCLEVADQVEGYYAAGGYVKTDGWSIVSAKTARSHKTASVTIQVLSAPTEVVESEGAQVRRLEGGEGTYLLSLLVADTTWVVTDLEAVAQ